MPPAAAGAGGAAAAGACAGAAAGGARAGGAGGAGAGANLNSRFSLCAPAFLLAIWLPSPPLPSLSSGRPLPHEGQFGLLALSIRSP